MSPIKKERSADLGEHVGDDFGQRAAQQRQPGRIDGVVGPDAATGDGDEAGVAQDLEVVRDSGLAELKLAFDVADADLATEAAE